MALAVRATTQVSNATGATFSVTKPTGTEDGDLIVAFQSVSLSGGSAPASPGEGWSALDALSYATGTHRIMVWYKTAASEPASWTFNNTSGIMKASSVTVFAVSGGATVEGSVSGSGSGTTADPGAYTTTNANALLLAAWAIASNVGETITPHVSWSAVGGIGSSSERQNAGSKAQAAAGAVTNRTATLSGSINWGAYLVALYAPPPAPVAAFSGTPTSGEAPLEVVFTDASTNTPTSWLWEKNDGSGWVNFEGTPTAQNPTEEFAEGTWDVRLTATNAGGSDDETKLDYIAATSASSGAAGGTIRKVSSRKNVGGGILRRRVGRRL